jgi:hypoxanthine phosphoribosyltransferase
MEELTYEKFLEACKELSNRVKVEKFRGLYGIPRGGWVVAVYLSHILELPIIRSLPEYGVRDILVVDDISDTGFTLMPYQQAGYRIATIYYNKKSKVTPDWWILEQTDFIKFPWETYRTAKVDYKK